MFPEVYVNTFGVGAPLAGAPVYAVLDLFVDIEHDRFWWWHGSALTASLLTALFVFLTARGFVEPVPAALIALAFGLGSCAWPVSSQALWQHPASTFFLSLGAWLLLRSEGRPLAAACCGAPRSCQPCNSRRLQLQPDGMERPVARIRPARARQPVALGPTPDRLCARNAKPRQVVLPRRASCG